MLSLLDIFYDIQTNIKEVAPKNSGAVDISIGNVNLLLEKTALHSGINIAYGLKGLCHRSISYQSLILFSEKDLPRLWLRKAWKVRFMNPYIRKKWNICRGN